MLIFDSQRSTIERVITWLIEPIFFLVAVVIWIAFRVAHWANRGTR